MRVGYKIAAIVALASSLSVEAALSSVEELWVHQVEPILDRHCFKCHGGVRQRGGLDLRSLENILKGGDQGPALIPGKPDESHLVQFVQPDSDSHMPPDEKKQLTSEEIATLKNWVAKLPKVPADLVTEMGKAGWQEKYVMALQKDRKPIWIPPSNAAPSDVIDGFIKRSWKEKKQRAADTCDDRTFLRRVYLDLAGRIPTLAETDRFLQDRRKDRRAQLIDQLLSGEDYPRHMREIFDVVLMGRGEERAERRRESNQWFAFLETEFKENRPWDQIVSQLIVARPTEDKERGALWYLYERKDNYQAMAEAIAPVAFGAQIGCAQCHNHPLAWEIEQRHYWGLVAAFNRSKNVESKAGIGVNEAATGGFVNFANLKKESQPALLAFLNGKSVPEKRPAEGEKESDLPDLYLVPPPKEKEKPEKPAEPKFSRRKALADAVTDENPLLARAFVNRIWAMLMGRGIVHPVDQMDSKHRPSHPDLLDWLARDFEQSGYDIKRLIRNIALSKTYQLDSRWNGDSAPHPSSFARALDKPLSAEQLYRSMLIATGNEVASDGKVAGQNANELRQSITTAFPHLFAPEYNASLQQVMFLSNSPKLEQLLAPQGTNTAARLMSIQSPEERVNEAYRTVFGRLPDKTERAECLNYLKSRSTEAGLRRLLWALLTSAEFQFNH